MLVGVIGRSELLIEAAERLSKAGHKIALVVTAKEAPEYTAGAEDFRLLADRHGCLFLRTAKIGEHELPGHDDGQIDVAISVNYPGIIPQAVIDSFRLGILNAHSGDLPRYRGNACQAWAIVNGEERVGLCIHKMIGGELDAGDIVARDYHPVDIRTKVTELWDWMKRRVPELFEDAVEALARDPAYILERQSPNRGDALRCYPRQPEDGRIDWRCDALDVIRLINASNKPYTGAFSHLEGEKLIIWDANLVDDGEVFLAVPGQVTAIGPQWVQVACGSGKIQINVVEIGTGETTPDRLVTSLRTRLG